MAGRLEGKVAVVVGGGQMPGEGIGNGRATCLTLAREGAKVMVAARHLDRAQNTVDMIREEGGEAAAFQMDVVRREDCEALMAACKEKYGQIDVLVYNVGILPEFDQFTNIITDESWDYSMHVNLRGALFSYNAVIPYMQEQGGGSIINISSIASLITNIGHSIGTLTYAFAKRGLNCLRENYAMTYAKDGIRCNTVILGPVKSIMGIKGAMNIMGEVTYDEASAFKDKYVPLKGGQGVVWDTANAVLFLACDESKFITGVGIPVDGGATTRRG